MPGVRQPDPSAALETWLDLLTRFAAYCTAIGVRRLARVDEAICIDWIEAPLSNKSNRAVRAHEVTVNDRGHTNEVALTSRNQRRPRARRWVWYVVVRVECPHGEKTVNGQTCHEIRLPLSQ